MNDQTIAIKARFRDGTLSLRIPFTGSAPSEPSLLAAIALSGIEPRHHDLASDPAWVRFDESMHEHTEASLARDFGHCLACLRPPVA